MIQLWLSAARAASPDESFAAAVARDDGPAMVATLEHVPYRPAWKAWYAGTPLEPLVEVATADRPERAMAVLERQAAAGDLPWSVVGMAWNAVGDPRRALDAFGAAEHGCLTTGAARVALGDEAGGRAEADCPLTRCDGTAACALALIDAGLPALAIRRAGGDPEVRAALYRRMADHRAEAFALAERAALPSPPTDLERRRVIALLDAGDVDAARTLASQGRPGLDKGVRAVAIMQAAWTAEPPPAALVAVAADYFPEAAAVLHAQIHRAVADQDADSALDAAIEALASVPADPQRVSDTAFAAWKAHAPARGAEAIATALIAQRTEADWRAAIDALGALRTAAGWMAVEEGRALEALAFMQAAAALRPTDPSPQEGIAVAAWRLGRLPDSVSAWAAVVAMDPTHENAVVNAVAVEMQRGRHDEALAWLGATEGIDTSLRDRLATDVAADRVAGTARSLAAGGRTDDAYRAIDEAESALGAHATLDHARGDVLLGEGRGAEAAEAYARAVQARPADAWARMGLARALAAAGDAERARAVAASTDPGADPATVAALTSLRAALEAPEGPSERVWSGAVGASTWSREGSAGTSRLRANLASPVISAAFGSWSVGLRADLVTVDDFAHDAVGVAPTATASWGTQTAHLRLAVGASPLGFRGPVRPLAWAWGQAHWRALAVWAEAGRAPATDTFTSWVGTTPSTGFRGAVTDHWVGAGATGAEGPWLAGGDLRIGLLDGPPIDALAWGQAGLWARWTSPWPAIGLRGSAWTVTHARQVDHFGDGGGGVWTPRRFVTTAAGPDLQVQRDGWSVCAGFEVGPQVVDGGDTLFVDDGWHLGQQVDAGAAIAIPGALAITGFGFFQRVEAWHQEGIGVAIRPRSGQSHPSALLSSPVHGLPLRTEARCAISPVQ